MDLCVHAHAHARACVCLCVFVCVWKVEKDRFLYWKSEDYKFFQPVDYNFS